MIIIMTREALIAIITVFYVTLVCAQQDENPITTISKSRLDENSVIFISGAATHLGSQLALALHHTYNVSKLILVDDMNTLDVEMSLYTGTKVESNKKRFSLSEEEQEKLKLQKLQAKQSLTSFEFKRQRLFHVLQSIGCDIFNEKEYKDDNIICQNERVEFYKADIRPSIPQYFDYSYFPLLDYIFNRTSLQNHMITHVVHLEDEYLSRMNKGKEHIVPRSKADTRFGMIDGLLEQLRVEKNKNESSFVPSFTYASSSEIYNSDNTTNSNGIFSEEWNITTPVSSFGMSKLLDEILARSYSNIHGIGSVGLRFFQVYGPWNTPGSTFYEMAETAISSSGPLIPLTSLGDVSIYDFIYIDDAIDAILQAMQFDPSKNDDSSAIVFNVGTGHSSTYSDVSQMMEKYFPRNDDVERRTTSNLKNEDNYSTKKAIASIDRARKLLGFQPRISLEDGIIKTLAWHYDRFYPFGDGRNNDMEEFEPHHVIQKSGMISCSPFDKECLNGFTIFPCSADCSHSQNCSPSIYDDIILISRTITKSCLNVMYTVDLRKDLNAIPSASSNRDYSSILGEHCNVAFVNENSSLMMRLKYENGLPQDKNIGEELIQRAEDNDSMKQYLLKHGFWTLLPVSIPLMQQHDFEQNMLLPKLSPGYFFSQYSKYALYCDANIGFKDVNYLFKIMESQPRSSGKAGDTIMIFGTKSQSLSSTSYSSLQEKTYNSMKTIFGGNVGIPGGYTIDTSWLIHTIALPDAHNLRCDMIGEVFKWKASNDLTSIDFILSLNEFWSSILSRWNNVSDEWWYDYSAEGHNTKDSKIKISISTGKWIAIPIPNADKFSFVRLLPSNAIGVEML